jgi:hypothetical protein
MPFIVVIPFCFRFYPRSAQNVGPSVKKMLVPTPQSGAVGNIVYARNRQGTAVRATRPEA